MSDTFNHFHYLDPKLLEKNSGLQADFDWKKELQLQQKNFNQFKFVVIKNNEILYCDEDLKTSLKINDDVVELSFSNQQVFLLRLHTKTSQDNIEFFNTTLVMQNISLAKSDYQLNITSKDNNSFYLLNNHKTLDLFNASIKFDINGDFSSYFIQDLNQQKQKLAVYYHLSTGAQLIHKSLSNIQVGQLQDDSIEIFHSKESKSEIFYESLNRGRLASQVNSVINKDSENCETHQLLSHLILDENAQTLSKPNLMISNPRVVASHGNSIGSFNTDSIFYLQQRGIDSVKAYEIIANSKILNFINQLPLGQFISAYLEKYI